MPEIRVLPDLLVSKIAAGEVVERPASVVKELLENAIDAGANHVEVAVEDGGKQLIRVADDGCGMSADDLRLAVTPHATSKLSTEEDLYRIGTLGFRGEALASIGAVSHLRMVSRRHEADEGGEIRVVGEQVESCSAAGCPPGTCVEVRDLFFNVPARRKFLRTTNTELGHVTEHLARLALAHPDLGFELLSGNRVKQRLAPGQSLPERIGALFGPELVQDLIVVVRSERGLDIQAYAAPPARSRANAGGQYVFVNGRFIRDRVINYAIREAYRGLLESNRYPIIFLFLTLDPAAVDVNAHPTKIEVRWQDGNLIRSQVLSALRETFLRTDLTPALRTDRSGGPIDEADREDIRQRIARELKSVRPIVVPDGERWSPGASSGAAPTPHAAAPGAQTAGPGAGADALWESLSARGVPAGRESGQHLPATAEGSTGPPRESRAEQRRPTIQLHNTYLVTETDDGLIIIDQHALHERVLYEQLRQRLTLGPLEAQRLLLPETVEATPQQIAVLQAHEELLERLGIEVTSFGNNAVAVQAFPSLLGDVDAKAFMHDLIDKLSDQGGSAHPEVLIHELLDMMACKAAVKAGDALTHEEIDALIAAKDLVEKSSNCPHGRPTTLRLGLRDLERQFKRT